MIASNPNILTTSSCIYFRMSLSSNHFPIVVWTILVLECVQGMHPTCYSDYHRVQHVCTLVEPNYHMDCFVSSTSSQALRRIWDTQCLMDTENEQSSGEEAEKFCKYICFFFLSFFSLLISFLKKCCLVCSSCSFHNSFYMF